MVCPRLAISFSYLPDFPHKAQVYPEHRFSERYSSLSNKPRYMLNNTISQLNAEQWSRTYTLWLPWHQLIHCYLDNCKFLYTYQLACTLTTELMLPKNLFTSIKIRVIDQKLKPALNIINTVYCAGGTSRKRKGLTVSVGQDQNS